MLVDTVGYDYGLLILAVAICAAGCFTTFTIYSHLLARGSAFQPGWLLLNGFCCGVTIWATHFLIMKAHDAGLPMQHDPVLTMMSLAVAVAGTTLGVELSRRGEHTHSVAGGAAIGMSAVAVQLLGMLALSAPAEKEWSALLIVPAVLLGTAAPVGALLVYRELRGWRALGAGAVVLGVGLLALDLTAMAALTLTPDPDLLAAIAGEASEILPLIVAAGASLVLLAGYLVALMDRRAMREAFAQIGEVVDAAMEGLVIASNGRVVSVNARALELSERRREDLIGQPIFGHLLLGGVRQLPPNMGVALEMPLVRSDGSTLPVEVIRRPLHALGQGDEVYVFRDLDDRDETAKLIADAREVAARSEKALHHRNIVLDDVLSNISQGLCMFDIGQRVVIANQHYATIYGLPPNAVVPGMSLRAIIQMRIDNGIWAGETPAEYMAERLHPVLRPENTVHELNTGQIIAVGRRPLPDGGWVTTHEDITERRRIEAQINHLVYHDALTDLHSRAALRDRLEEVLAIAGRHDRRVAVVIFGLDRFGEINDELGTDMGDALLKAAAKRLRAATRRTTVLGRFSDDKFVAIDVVEHPGRDAAAMTSRIQQAIRKPFLLGATSVEVTATAGIAVWPSDGTDADTLLRNADLAQHSAKAEARGSHLFFEPGLDRAIRARRALERDLAEALERDEFELHYQPLLSLEHNEVTGFEALLRWPHPDHGLMAPDAFLPVAEEMGIAAAIGEWVLRQACAEAALHWPTHLTIAVNVSEAQFGADDFIPIIIRTLAVTGLAAERLELDVTEKVMHQNPEEAIAKLTELSSLGVRIALDDFGAGFASLTYLRRLPFHKIKIDRSFVAGLSEREDSKVIIRTLARLGTGLRIATAAEGVETKEQLDIIRAEGCTEMQGFYFSPPKTANEVRQLFLRKAEAAAVA